jgi:hypothetical protein
MRIGFVGAEETQKKIHGLINPDVFFVEIIDYPQNQERQGKEEFGNFLNRIQKEVDGIVFTGRTVFDRARQCAPAIIPWTYLKRSTNSVLCALLKASIMGYDISKITYDLPYVTIKQMKEILCEKVGIDEKTVSIHRFNGTKGHEDFIDSLLATDPTPLQYEKIAGDFHLNHFRTGEAEVCLTASMNIVTTPDLADYPTFLVELGREDIIEALNDIRFEYFERERQRTQNKQIAVVSLKIELVEPYTHVIQDRRQITGTYHVENEILSFVKKFGATVEKTSNLQYIIYTHKSLLNNATKNMKKMEFAENLQSIGEVRKITIGIGFGETHEEAKRNALFAKTAAKNQPSSCYYISDDVDKIQGPFLIKQEDSQKDMQRVALERLSSEVAVGVTTLDALIKKQKQYGFQRVTVGELAEMCGVSFSKMNRIVAKLEEKGYAENVGNVVRSKTGRPRRLIELKLGFFQSD